VTIGRVLFELGRDPTKRCAILSNTGGQAQKILGSVAQYVERSAELHEVFPNLRPGRQWSRDAITVKRPTISKDPSVQATMPGGQILGSRLDLVIVDDMLDFEQTRTETQRKKAIDWFDSNVLGRVVVGGRVVVLGSAWHREDAMHILARRAAWTSARFAVEDDAGNPRWPERWPASRIANKRKELGPHEAARQLDCLARSDETALFTDEMIAVAFENGQKSRLSAERFGTNLIPYVMQLPRDCFTVAGVDLAVSKKSTADVSAISTVLVYADGSRELLSIEAGRWGIDEIVKRIIATHSRYQCSSIIVENNAAQDWAVQWTRKFSAVPVVPYTTGTRTKSLQWQANALATEMVNQKWSMRGANSNDVRQLVRDLLYFNALEHTGDRLASLLLARWGIEQASQRIEPLAIDFSRR
jgi:hypothetical protein